MLSTVPPDIYPLQIAARPPETCSHCQVREAAAITQTYVSAASCVGRLQLSTHVLLFGKQAVHVGRLQED